jgi:hypothetical protein
LPIGHVGQAGEYIAKILEWIQTPPPAVFNDGVNDRAALAGIGVADEEPVFLADGSGANGIFHEVVATLTLQITNPDLKQFLQIGTAADKLCENGNNFD